MNLRVELVTTYLSLRQAPLHLRCIWGNTRSSLYCQKDSVTFKDTDLTSEKPEESSACFCELSNSLRHLCWHLDTLGRLIAGMRYVPHYSVKQGKLAVARRYSANLASSNNIHTQVSSASFRD